MNNGMYYALLAAVCWMRFASKWVAFGSWAVFTGLAIASKAGWIT